MSTETQNQSNTEFLYGDLTEVIIGILIEVHKELGPYAREKQYCDLFEKKLKEKGIIYQRELRIGSSGNILDFLIDCKVIMEFKAVPYLNREHYDQVKRYLYQTGVKLGLLVNFRERRVNIKRVFNINNLAKNKIEL